MRKIKYAVIIRRGYAVYVSSKHQLAAMMERQDTRNFCGVNFKEKNVFDEGHDKFFKYSFVLHLVKFNKLPPPTNNLKCSKPLWGYIGENGKFLFFKFPFSTPWVYRYHNWYAPSRK